MVVLHACGTNVKEQLMLEKLQKLYNTLGAVETKGKSTIIMGTCLSYLEGLIREASKPEPEPKPVDMPAEPVVDVVDPDQEAE